MALKDRLEAAKFGAKSANQGQIRGKFVVFGKISLQNFDFPESSPMRRIDFPL